MNLLYWNLKNNHYLESIISDCINENEVDIALFSEYENVDFNLLKRKLSNQYNLLESLNACEKVIVLHRNTINLKLVREQHRYLLAKFNHKSKTYLLVGVHLPSNTHGNGSSDRKHVIRKIINDITEVELGDVQSSIIIGDMNANPFDAEMIEKDAFNSVLFKKIIKHQESVKYGGDCYKRFYNPIIEYIDETNESYGSFYYGSGNACLYWYCYDQLLVRKNLIDSIADFQYLKKVNNQSLLNTTKPNTSISDHLPLLVNLEI